MPRGTKTCPSCNRSVGPRTKTCECGHNFAFKDKNEVTPSVMGLPVKITKKKRRRRKKSIYEKGDNFDWRTLQPGDRIKVIQGSGPVWNIGEKQINMGYKGRFLVKELDDNGILATNISKGFVHSVGYCHIWMGPEQKSPIDPSLIKIPHKIKKMRPKNEITS